MSAENEENVNSHTESDQQEHPFGLMSPQFAVLVVLVGLIGPGLLVHTFEEANLSAVADLVWIVGYGTTIFVVWFIWVRPLDLVGSSAQDVSLTEESDQSETGTDEHDDKSEASATVDSSAQDLASTKEDTSQVSTYENLETSDSK
ncbi:hypothetical protein [Haloarcula nitratireducens]|uniref:Cox cluster protein n=1 Tax=Haloarcula nitratireducens TaxID=2487749 RepID=A0AAW4PK17_9EURY|nr:hypothetical protein [Halomicroarcula nitratireducens]MBX0297903.1 hypothetical protein [Halomicroarcula nitratireducens]